MFGEFFSMTMKRSEHKYLWQNVVIIYLPCPWDHQSGRSQFQSCCFRCRIPCKGVVVSLHKLLGNRFIFTQWVEVRPWWSSGYSWTIRTITTYNLAKTNVIARLLSFLLNPTELCCVRPELGCAFCAKFAMYKFRRRWEVTGIEPRPRYFTVVCYHISHTYSYLHICITSTYFSPW